jgi:hypothetical protein
MEKTDFRKSMKALFQPPTDRFCLVEPPRLQFVMVDGEGDPNVAPDYARAVQWLYGVSYALKFMSKTELERDYVVAPLEGLWWADDMNAFVARDKAAWAWTMMIMQPAWITLAMYEAAAAKASQKLGAAPPSMRLDWYDEGLSAQILHVGSYDDEGPVLRRLHEAFLPENGLAPSGRHHEIYLSDPRKTEPARLKTILRQPVRRL